MTDLKNPIGNLHGKEFGQTMMETPGAIILDVRTSEEFRGGRIPEAINIDVMDVNFSAEVTSLDKSKTYFVYCHSGGRSLAACNIMSSRGLKVYNLAGGISKWNGEVV